MISPVGKPLISATSLRSAGGSSSQRRRAQNLLTQGRSLLSSEDTPISSVVVEEVASSLLPYPNTLSVHTLRSELGLRGVHT